MYFCRLTFGKLRSCFSCGLAPPAGQWQNWLYGCQFENRCQTVYHNVFISPEFIKWKENYFSLRNYLLDINSFYWVAVVSCTFVFVICMPGSLFVLVLKYREDQGCSPSEVEDPQVYGLQWPVWAFGGPRSRKYFFYYDSCHRTKTLRQSFYH